MIDREINQDKQWVFSSILSRLESIKTAGCCLPEVVKLCTVHNAISELYVDFDQVDYRDDLVNFLAGYNGSQLRVLDIHGMAQPVQIATISKARELESEGAILEIVVNQSI